MKRFLCILWALALLLSLWGCTVNIELDSKTAADSDSDSRVSRPASDTDAVFEPLPDTLSDIPDNNGAGGIAIYESDLGFSFSAPGSWYAVTAAGTTSFYGCEEGEDSVRFYDLRSAEAGFGGTLVTVILYAPGEPYDYLPDYDLLAETAQGSYVALYPTDVQTDTENEELLNHHQYLSAGLRDILPEGFRLS